MPWTQLDECTLCTRFVCLVYLQIHSALPVGIYVCTDIHNTKNKHVHTLNCIYISYTLWIKCIFMFQLIRNSSRNRPTNTVFTSNSLKSSWHLSPCWTGWTPISSSSSISRSSSSSSRSSSSSSSSSKLVREEINSRGNTTK